MDQISSLETIPGTEQVRAALRELAGAKGTETVLREDAEGVYLIEWTVPGEAPGEKTEYAYRRKGKFKEHGTAATNIDVVFYDADGIPSGGSVLAEWIDGRWKRQ